MVIQGITPNSISRYLCREAPIKAPIRLAPDVHPAGGQSPTILPIQLLAIFAAFLTLEVAGLLRVRPLLQTKTADESCLSPLPPASVYPRFCYDNPRLRPLPNVLALLRVNGKMRSHCEPARQFRGAEAAGNLSAVLHRMCETKANLSLDTLRREKAHLNRTKHTLGAVLTRHTRESGANREMFITMRIPSEGTPA